MGRLSKATVGVVMAVVWVLVGANAWAQTSNDCKAGSADRGKHKSPDAVFQKMDANGDGAVSKDEFVAFHEARAKAAGREAPSKERIEKRFAAMDANADGKLTKDELTAGWGRMKERHGPGAKHGEKQAEEGAQQ